MSLGSSIWIRPEDINTYKKVVDRDAYAIRPIRNAQVDVRHVVDVGAHVGIFSCLMSEFFPSAEIISFEPLKDNLELCHSNFERMVPNGECLPYALGGEDKAVRLECRGSSLSTVREFFPPPQFSVPLPDVIYNQIVPNRVFMQVSQRGFLLSLLVKGFLMWIS